MTFPSGFSQGNSAFDLDLYINGVRYPLILAKDDKGNPSFAARTAPTIPPVIQGGVQSLDNRSVPPEQGIDTTVGAVMGGAGSWLSQPNRYAFGSGIFTGDGVIEPGPLVEATTATDGFDGLIRSVARHKGRWFVGTDTGNVYWWDFIHNAGADGTDTWQHVDQPDSSGNPVTDLIDFAIPSGDSILIALFDTAETYQYMDDFDPDANTGSWSDPSDSGQAYGKHGAVYRTTTLIPTFVMVNDPNELWRSDDPTDLSTWVGPTYIGDPSDAATDHFTSLSVSPDGTRFFVGKKLGLYGFDLDEDVVNPLEKVAPDRGRGLENFAWFQRMGGRLYVQATDVDIVEVDRYDTKALWGFGPYRAGTGVPEMQQAVVAMASDDREWVYVALDGDEGRVMMFRYQDDGRVHYHGAYVATGVSIHNRMWYGADPDADDKAEFLWISQSGESGLPFRARIPEGSPEVDTSATFSDGAWIRFGYEDVGQVNLPKVLLSSSPRTRNLDPDGPTATISTRTQFDGPFVDLMTADESPVPSNVDDEVYTNTYGYVYEIKVTLNNPDPTTRPIVDAVTTRALRRFVDGSNAPRLDILSFTVDARTSVNTRNGAQSRMSMQGLYGLIREARGTLFPPRLVRPFDGSEWIVDVLAVGSRWVDYGGGPGQAMLIDVTCQQLPTSGVSTIYRAHTHEYEEELDVTDEDQFVMTYIPFVEPEVFLDRYLIIGGGVDYTWTPGSHNINFTEPVTGSLRVHYARYL